MPKIKNIIIFVVIAAIFVLIYIFFIKASPDQGSLVSSTSTLPDVNTAGNTNTSASASTPVVAKDFLALLLSVKSIELNDSIFADPAFNKLHDSSITLTPDGTEGRPNPFAQFGNDILPQPVISPVTPSAPTPPTANP